MKKGSIQVKGMGGVTGKVPFSRLLHRMAQQIINVRPKKKASIDGRRGLTDEQVRLIRKTFNGRRDSVRPVAAQLGISFEYAYKIALGETHKHVTAE